MSGNSLLISLHAVHKDYHGLRPLRVDRFEVRESETIGLLGFDAAAAEVLVNLVTGASLPDAGDVNVFGFLTRDITSSDQWFQLLERFGVLSERVFLLDELTIEQNLALPISLAVNDMPADVAQQMQTLGMEVGIPSTALRLPVAGADAHTRLRVRLGKALALNPRVLLAEHPNATLSPSEAKQFSVDLAAIAARRSLAMVVLTADASFAASACKRVLSLRPATGELLDAPPRFSWRRLLPRQ